MTNAVLSSNEQVLFNVNGAGRKPVEVLNTLPNGKRERRRKDLVAHLLDRWVKVHTYDGSIVFAKHFYHPTALKRRTVLQLLSGCSFETGLWTMRNSKSFFEIKDVYYEDVEEARVTLYCNELDAYSPDSNIIHATQEEMGKEPFMEFLVANHFIPSEDLKYLTAKGSTRKELAKGLETIVLDIL